MALNLWADAHWGPSWSDLEKLIAYPFTSEADLMSTIAELHDQYTTKRHSPVLDAPWDQKKVAAYCYFYFATNIPKLAALLRHLPKELVWQMSKCSWIDFGAGPGTYTVAWYQWLKLQNLAIPPLAYLIEQDSVMRMMANKVCDFYLNDVEHLQIHKNCENLQLSGKDSIGPLLFFGHAMNEMPFEEVMHVIQKVAPRFLVFLEPGTKASFAQLMKIRSALLSEKFMVHYPCPNMQVCPALFQEGEWCHQYADVKHDPMVERLCQMLKKDRRHNPVLFHVYEKRMDYKISQLDSPLNSPLGELIFKGPKKSKGKIEWTLCHAHSHHSTLKLIPVEVLERGFSKEQLEHLRTLTHGDRLPVVSEIKTTNVAGKVQRVTLKSTDEV